ncbi:CDP-diacylglycerol--glycerol-3-phosphate 3-phosphatidyltransferase [Clostridia bacterium]|nr:CDP-diacylglycerol--glycerol-3-phosphate 3-phosphatidyltransferase [Clostridia bacterium]
MNLPNKLTVARVAMIPIFLFFFFAGFIPWNYFIALLVFTAAAVTDSIDGKIARERGLVTDFGKLMDPLADKLLVMSAMVSLIPLGMIHAAIVVVILAREFMVTAIRQLAAGKGIVIAADGAAKLKTIFQMIWICYDLAFLFAERNLQIIPAILAAPVQVLHYVLIVCVLALTGFSGINYLWKNRGLFADA